MLHGPSKRHDISPLLLRISIGKCEACALDNDVRTAGLLQEYEAKIAAPVVDRQALSSRAS
jgi:transposase